MEGWNRLRPSRPKRGSIRLLPLRWIGHGGMAGQLGSVPIPCPARPFMGCRLRAGKETVGVLAVQPDKGRALHPTTKISSPASPINRPRLSNARSLAADIAQARLQTETERLRSNLLSTISHDLRTPLVAILGATTSLRDYWDKFDDTARRDLFATIEDESDRLNRFVQNLLDMTQLVSGGLKLKRQADGCAGSRRRGLGALTQNAGRTAPKSRYSR